MAGGLDPALVCGAVLLPEEIVAPDGAAVSATAAEWCQRLRAALPASCIAGGGRLLTSDRPLASREAKAAAWRESRAAAVDMESAAGSPRSPGRLGSPFIVLRIIVDTASDQPTRGRDRGEQRRPAAVSAGCSRRCCRPRAISAG